MLMPDKAQTALVRLNKVRKAQEGVDEETKQFVKLKLNHAVSPLENPNKIKSYRKAVARLQTELRKRQIEQS